MTKQTQEDRILSWLKSGVSLTPLHALRHVGCMRLGARIYDLKRKGYKIHKRMVKTPSGAHVAEYWME
jgi:hypothetical protein